MVFVLAMILLKNCIFGVKQQSLVHSFILMIEKKSGPLSSNISSRCVIIEKKQIINLFFFNNFILRYLSYIVVTCVYMFPLASYRLETRMHNFMWGVYIVDES
jgi:hypothetical protein